MNNTNKMIIGFSVAAVGGTAAYFVVKNKKKRDLEKSLETQTPKNGGYVLTDNKNTGPGTDVPKSKWIPERFPLRRGMIGDTIKRVQSLLNAKYRANIAVDGKFGKNTENALYKAIGKKVLSDKDFVKYARYA